MAHEGGVGRRVHESGCREGERLVRPGASCVVSPLASGGGEEWMDDLSQVLLWHKSSRYRDDGVSGVRVRYEWCENVRKGKHGGARKERWSVSRSGARMSGHQKIVSRLALTRELAGVLV